MIARRTAPRDTQRSTNIEVSVAEPLSNDEMETVLRDHAARDGLLITHVTVLGRKRFPGNRHWHFKRDLSEKGCLDVTYWPDGPLMWVTIRHAEPPWVHEAGPELAASLGATLAGTG